MCNAIYSQNVIQLFDKQRAANHLRSGQSESLKINTKALQSLIATQSHFVDFIRASH